MRQAAETYMQAVNRLTEKAVNVRSRGARCLSRLSLDLRHRQPLPARDPAAAQDHHRRDAAALQRHADRRVRAAHRGAPAHRVAARRDRRQARFLARRSPICRPPSTAAARLRRAATIQPPSPRQRLPTAATEMESQHVFAPRIFGHRRARRRVSASAAACRPRPSRKRRSWTRPAMQPPLVRPAGPDYQPGRHAQRLDAAVAHERRLEGVPPRRRAGGARVRARA